MRRGTVIALAVLLLAVAVGTFRMVRRDRASASPPRQEAGAEATFVGAAECLPCHKTEAALWQASDHARAMERPSRSSVKAPFAGEQTAAHGVTTTFSTRDGRFGVRTDDRDGAMRDFEVAYTFGVDPLQQYLIATPGGRYQALGLAWDTRPAASGGERWYPLHPDEPVRSGDVLHWTSPSQNWNFMCAECHSTNVRKGYRDVEDRYETTWSDINVACEACHGPGSRHVAWARQSGGDAQRAATTDPGLPKLDAADDAAWILDPATGIAQRDRPRTSRAEVELCARCHARRAQLTDDYQVGRPLMDTHRPSLLEAGLYFADGQIEDEVYEYGSFLQSRMYAQGVTCSDCHNPHQLKLESTPDEACRRCHLDTRFATPEHHHHRPGSVGSSCVSCHMTARSYMGVDRRRDHSFRVPRPDLSDRIGAPNACTLCHADRPARWAADWVVTWYGAGRSGRPHYGEALEAGRSMAADARPRLTAVVRDSSLPAIVRATALSLLAPSPGPDTASLMLDATRDPDPLLRLAAVEGLRGAPAPQAAQALAPLLYDRVRSVRVDAGRALATTPDSLLNDRDRAARAGALAEWEAIQRFNADSAAARTNLAGLFTQRGELDRAAAEYQAAIRLEPWFAPASVNLADLLKARGRDDEGERVLRAAIARAPEVGELHVALGLVLVRLGQRPAALAELADAARVEPRSPDIQYTYAVALHSLGRPQEAMDVLERTSRAFPGHRDVLAALASFAREAGDLARAEIAAERLAALPPPDPAAASLLEAIRRARASGGR